LLKISRTIIIANIIETTIIAKECDEASGISASSVHGRAAYAVESKYVIFSMPAHRMLVGD
jgi:hypothetical protein